MEGRKRKRRSAGSGAGAKSNNMSTSTGTGGQHPPPPPPPPQSLINLLQSDESVMQYFASLQSNLEADVGAWRDKANKYKREAVTLRRRLERMEEQEGSEDDSDDEDGPRRDSNNRAKARSKQAAASKSRHKSDTGKRADGKKTSAGTRTTSRRKGADADISISKHDEDDADDNVETTHDVNSNASTDVASTSRHSPADRFAILSQLSEAYDCFERLGISLVEELHVSFDTSTANNTANVDAEGGQKEQNVLENKSKENGDDEVANTDKTGDGTPEGTPSVVVTRRSDHDVVSDLMRSLRSLVRVSTRINTGAASGGDDDDGNSNRYRALARQYEPFRFGSNAIGNGADGSSEMTCLPCCYESLDTDQHPHPAAEGLRLAIRALTIMDTFCGPVLLSSDSSWDDLFESSITAADDGNARNDERKLERMRHGLRNRKELVNSVVLSLHGDIATRWAAEDRLARSGVGALLFEDDDLEGDVDGDDVKDDDGSSIPASTFDSRSYNRLALLVDRIMYARLVSAVYQHRCQYDSAAKLALGYVVSSTPSLGVEDYPRHQPVLSFCVLDALLQSNRSENACTVFSARSWFDFFFSVTADNDSDTGNGSLLSKVLALSLRVAFKIWTDRKGSPDGRIRDISRVELAAFHRIAHTQGTWLSSNGDVAALSEEEAVEMARNITSKIVDGCTSTDFSSNDENSALSLLLGLVLIGDISHVAEISSKMKTKISAVDASATGRLFAARMLLACCQAFQGIRSRNLLALPNDISADSLALDHVLESLKTSPFSGDQGLASKYLPVLAQCSAALADGLGVDKFSSQLPSALSNSASSVHSTDIINVASAMPVIRVINLERRADRWNSIVGQARASQLLVVRGPAALLDDGGTTSGEGAYWGNYAFDGRGELDSDDANSFRLDDFVAPTWFPSRLRAFDTNAKEEEVAVPASSTERACALSHIACWKGVERSLRCYQGDTFSSGTTRSVETDAGRRLLRISGFATGPALLHENKAMDSAPVCVIMEDDAVLVDRFRDRLSTLLTQLPRDFHFCSLGYGKPKNAPMIEFSDAIGIPTFLWYLTGYILSLEGAKLLLGGLPVNGPIDSWIGLKISSNWENDYGYAIGVGRDPRKSTRRTEDLSSSNNALARKDFGKLMKFRAFAALVPLCSQKVGQSQAGSGAGGGGTVRQASKNQQRIVAKWRDRDSDVVYSGGK